MKYGLLENTGKLYALDEDLDRLKETVRLGFFEGYTIANIRQFDNSEIVRDAEGNWWWKGYEPEDILSNLKTARQAALKAAFEAAAETAHCPSSLGFEIDANDTANRNVASLIRQLVRGDIETATFRDWNNQYHLGLTLTDLNTIQGEIDANGSRLYAVKWAYEQQIAQAQDVETLEAITFQF